MSIPQLPERSLRVGLLFRGEVQAELLARVGRPVTMGANSRNDLVVPGRGRREVLFEPLGEGFVLVVRPGMTGRIALASGVFDLVGAPSDEASGLRHVRLDPQSRGRVELGEHTVLFQFVPTPLVAARPAADFRPPLLGETDQTFAGFLSAFSAAAVAFFGVASATPRPSEIDVAAAPDRVIERILLNTVPLPKPMVEERVAQPTDHSAPRSRVVERIQDRIEQHRDRVAARADDGRSAAQRVAESRFFQAIVGTRGDSARDDLFGGSDRVGAQLQGDLDRVTGFDDTASLHPMVSGGGLGDRADATVGELGRSGAGGSTGVGGPARGQTPVVRPEGGLQVDSAPTQAQEDIRRRMRTYSGAVASCYEAALRQSPELSGRIEVSLSLAAGRVSDAVVTTNTTGSQDLALCVESRALGWRFDPSITLDFVAPFALTKG